MKTLPVRLVVVLVLGAGLPAEAQLDPLLFLKATRPNVIIGLDLSSRMQRDTIDRYLDPVVYRRRGEPFESTIGVHVATTAHQYRRRYVDLRWRDLGDPVRAEASRIETVGDLEPGFLGFDDTSRLGLARLALRRVVEANRESVRFGLVTTRRGRSGSEPTDGGARVLVSDPAQQAPTDAGIPGLWNTGIPRFDVAGEAVPVWEPAVRPDRGGSPDQMLRWLATDGSDGPRLRAGGADRSGASDWPVARLLDDLRDEALRLARGDTTCCNTVVVLITAGADQNGDGQDLTGRARQFLAVGGRRVPVYVVALAPTPDAAVDLRAVAQASGGQYRELAGAAGGTGVDSQGALQIASALHAAIQHAFCTFDDFNSAPTPRMPYGAESVFPTSSPMVGTVDLEGAVDAEGRVLPLTRVTRANGSVVPQRDNVVITAGLVVPGFTAHLAAARVYRPVPDPAAAVGYRFVADGTPLWSAFAPSPERRNLYTVVPGRGIVPFDSGSAAVLQPFLRVSDPAALIDFIRRLPLGAVVTSTPALLTPPAGSAADASFSAYADVHAQRRTLVFVGMEDGCLHAFDARTGVEVWAVVPFNLLPKLRGLREGQPVDEFRHFVGGSPRLADVRIGGAWRTYLVCGQGPGGTFYQTFDVSLDGIGLAVPPDADRQAELLAWFANPTRIPFVWAFPRYEAFDPTIEPHGDVSATATDIEKTVGQTWSTPAVGIVGSTSDGRFVAVLGSGFLPRRVEQQPNRGGVRGGTRLYMLDMATGLPLDDRDVGSDGLAESVDRCALSSCARLKNAIQADPLATGPAGTSIITHTYVGDLDGRLWRLDIGTAGGTPAFATSPRLLFSASAEHPLFGSVALGRVGAGEPHLFLATGSDMLPLPGASPAPRLIGLAEVGGAVVTRFDLHLLAGEADGARERASAQPVLGGDVVFFTTTASTTGSRCLPDEARVYALDHLGGEAYGPGRSSSRSGGGPPLPAVSIRRGHASAPMIAGRHLYVATGRQLQVLGDPDRFNESTVSAGLRVLSWKEIR